jgi:hypothetical protein
MSDPDVISGERGNPAAKLWVPTACLDNPQDDTIYHFYIFTFLFLIFNL